MTIAAAVVTLGMLFAIFRLVVTGRGFSRSGPGFSLRRASQGVGSWTGEAVGRLLAIVSITTLLLTTSFVPQPVLVRFAVPAILAVAIGAAVSISITDRALALVAISMTIAELVHAHGPAAGVAVAVIALLAAWVMGLIRGFRP